MKYVCHHCNCIDEPEVEGGSIIVIKITIEGVTYWRFICKDCFDAMKPELIALGRS